MRYDDVVQRAHLNYFDAGFPTNTPIPTDGRVRLPLMKMQFKIVSGYDPVKVQIEVTFYLSEGWTLYGNLAMDSGRSGQVMYAQSLTREELQVDN